MATQQTLRVRWTKEEGCPICHSKEIRSIYRRPGSDFFCSNCLAVYTGSNSQYPDSNPDYFTGMIYLEELTAGIPASFNLDDLRGALEALRTEAEKVQPR